MFGDYGTSYAYHERTAGNYDGMLASTKPLHTTTNHHTCQSHLQTIFFSFSFTVFDLLVCLWSCLIGLVFRSVGLRFILVPVTGLRLAMRNILLFSIDELYRSNTAKNSNQKTNAPKKLPSEKKTHN